jgi:hypothetical protein
VNTQLTALTRKIGPLPAWGWLTGVAGVAYWWQHRHATAKTATSSTTSAATDTTASDYSGSYRGAAGIGAAAYGSAGGGDLTQPTDLPASTTSSGAPPVIYDPPTDGYPGTQSTTATGPADPLPATTTLPTIGDPGFTEPPPLGNYPVKPAVSTPHTPPQRKTPARVAHAAVGPPRTVTQPTRVASTTGRQTPRQLIKSAGVALSGVTRSSAPAAARAREISKPVPVARQAAQPSRTTVAAPTTSRTSPATVAPRAATVATAAPARPRAVPAAPAPARTAVAAAHPPAPAARPAPDLRRIIGAPVITVPPIVFKPGQGSPTIRRR